MVETFICIWILDSYLDQVAGAFYKAIVRWVMSSGNLSCLGINKKIGWLRMMQKCERDNIQFRTMSFPKTGELHRQTESLNQLKTKWENINEKNPILSSTSISQNGFQKLPFCSEIKVRSLMD